MSSKNYLKKLNVVIENTTKIKLVKKDNRKNARPPLINKELKKLKKWWNQILNLASIQKPIIDWYVVEIQQVNFMVRVKYTKKSTIETNSIDDKYTYL